MGCRRKEEAGVCRYATVPETTIHFLGCCGVRPEKPEVRLPLKCFFEYNNLANSCRTFESTVLDRLLEWASNAISKSLNQPTLPHVVIVLNATENVEEDEWDPVIATKRLLEGNRDAISHEPLWEHKARFWRERGKSIETTRDLLECYYASITAVRIPARGRWMLMDKQVEKLFSIINQDCEASYLAKKTVHMLPTAEKLQLYLQAAYDHFSRDLHMPFDFVREALKHNPIPRDFGGNILNLALCVQDTIEGGSRGSASRIFEKIVPMLASCVQLDSYRQDLMGKSPTLIPMLKVWRYDTNNGQAPPLNCTMTST